MCHILTRRETKRGLLVRFILHIFLTSTTPHNMSKTLLLVAVLALASVAIAQVSQQTFTCMFGSRVGQRSSAWIPHVNNGKSTRKFDAAIGFFHDTAYLDGTGNSHDICNLMRNHSNVSYSLSYEPFRCQHSCSY